MSYFNSDQRDYMRSMATVPPEKKCWCCWYMLGECPHCPSDKTGADKVAVWCQRCHNTPDANGVITHTIGCVAEGKP